MDERPESKKKQVREYFSGVALPDFGVDSRFFPAMGERLVELAGITKGSMVLDIAAGRGASLFPAAERVGGTGEVVGIDLAESMVVATSKEIMHRKLRNVSILQMDAEQLEFESEYFHYFLCGFALFFLPHLDRALAEFYRVLKPGGRVVASTFGKEDEQQSWYEKLLEKYGLSRQIPVAQSLHDPAVLERIFSEANFSEIEFLEESFICYYEDEDDWWSRLWSTADRIALEGLSEERRTALRIEAFAKVRDFERDGVIQIPYHVLFTLASKV